MVSGLRYRVWTMNILHQTLAGVQLACQILWCHFLSVPSGQWEQSAECAAERIPAVPALQPGPEGLYGQPQIPSAARHTSATGQLTLQCSSGQTFQRLQEPKSYNLFSRSQKVLLSKNSFIFRNFSLCKNCFWCVFTTVCVLGWVKCRAQMLSMGHHTWPHTTSLSLLFKNFFSLQFPFPKNDFQNPFSYFNFFTFFFFFF